MKLDAEAHRLWDALIAAERTYRSAAQLFFDLGRLADRCNDPDFEIKPPLSEDLQPLVRRAKELVEAFTLHQDELQDRYQSSTWRFAAHVFDLYSGDCVHYTDDRGRPQTLSADHVSIWEPNVGELYLNGRLFNKDGKPGKRTEGIRLLHTPWTKTANQQMA
jgi:hypothetical protein